MTTTADEATRPSPTTISRIAVGVDGYPESHDAVVLGATIGGATEAELMLVAVHPDPIVVLPEEMVWKRLEWEAEGVLREARDSLAPGARTVVETDSSVPRALERVMCREHRDLLIVGSSRHGCEGRVRIGKRTRRLLCHFQSVLAIAPRGMRNGPTPELRQIAVGFDGGSESDSALMLAVSIARAAGAELQLWGVIDDRVPPAGWSPLDIHGLHPRRCEEVLTAEMDALRNVALSVAEAAGATARVEVVRGRPANALLRLSERVDLLVIGSGRWGPVARLRPGSTGEALAHGSVCPLLVVPRHVD